MPPFHDPHTLYRIQQHLGSTVICFFLPSLEWRVLEEQTNPVVAHICADIDCELEEDRMKEFGSDRPVRLHTQAPLFHTYDQKGKCCGYFRAGCKQPQ